MLNRIGKWFSLSTEETLPSKVYTSFVGLSLKENKLMQNELYAIKSVTLAIQIKKKAFRLIYTIPDFSPSRKSYWIGLLFTLESGKISTIAIL